MPELESQESAVQRRNQLRKSYESAAQGNQAGVGLKYFHQVKDLVDY